jgi:hypothetical protein
MKKLGKGNHGDVILVERKNDSQVIKTNFNYLSSYLL